MSLSKAVTAIGAAVSRSVRSAPIASSSRLFSSSPSTSNTTPTSVSEPEKPAYFESQEEAQDALSFPTVEPLSRRHNIHVATIQLSAYSAYPLELYTEFAYHAAHALNIPTNLPSSLPNRKELVTVIKGPFVHKKKQENFMRILHKREIKAYDASRESLDLWLRYIKKNGIGGVGCRARVFEFVEYGFGRKEVESVEKQFEELGVEGAEGAGEIEGDVQRAADDLIKKLTGEIDALELQEPATGEGETGIEEIIRDAATHIEDAPKTRRSEAGMATASAVDEVVESEPVNKVDDEGKEIRGSAEEILESAIPEHPEEAHDSKDTRESKANVAPEKNRSLADQLLEEAEEKVERPVEGVKAKTGNQSEQKDEAKAAAADVGTSEPKV